MMKRLNKKGVSLAELLAVVVIMGIIAAIAIPLVGNVIETSKKKAFLGDLVTVTEAARTYCLVEGKETVDSICYKYGKGTGAGLLTVNDNTGEVTLTPVESTTKPTINSCAGKLQGTELTKFKKYISKDLTAIGKAEDTNILIYTDGSKYYVNVDLAGTQGFKTSGVIDPTNEKAIELIPDKVA